MARGARTFLIMRFLAILLGSLVAVVAVAALSAPWWLGLALSWFGPSFGVHFETYERLGYARFRLEQVEFKRAPVHVRVEWAEGDTPLLWLWRRATGTPGAVSAGEWSVDVTRPTAPRRAGAARGWVPLRGRLEKIADYLGTWIPETQTGPGSVSWPKGGLTLGPVTWKDRTLTSPEIGYKRLVASVELAVPAGEPWRARLRAEERAMTADVQSFGSTVDGVITWSEQPAKLAARFPAEGWRPEEASLLAENWDLPAERARLGAQYARLQGGARIDWRDGRLTAEATAAGLPRESSPAPPLAVNVRGHGGAGGFVAESLEVRLPGATAHLTEPVAIDRSGRLQSPQSRFAFSADLAQLPWLQASGTLAGEGLIAPDDGGLAKIDFNWHGENLTIAESRLRTASAQGRFVWPQLDLADGRLVSDTGDELQWAGGWDFRTREVRAATVKGRFRWATFAAWLPKEPSFELLEIDARASGPWRTVAHEGNGRIEGVTLKTLKPFAATLQWQGRGEEIETFSLETLAGATRLQAKGSADRAGMSLTELSFSNGSERRLELTQPARVVWAPALRLEPAELAGTNARIHAEATLGPAGLVALEARGLRSEWLAELIELPPVGLALETLTLRGQWSDGPAEFGADGVLTVGLGNGRSARISTRLKGNGKGIEIEALRVAEGEADIVNATGRLPVVVQPGGAPFLRLDTEAPFALNALTSPNPKFWAQLAQLASVEIEQPEARARLSGTLAQPRGEARFRAQRLAPMPGKSAWKWPRVESLDIYLVGEQDGVRLDRFSVAVDDQEIRAQGWLPVAAERWRELMRNPRQFVRRGELHVEVPDADIAAIAAYFPTYIAPKGKAQLDLRFTADETIRGFLRVQDATLRPIGPLGVVQEINADLRFDGRTARVHEVTGRMGGQLVTLQGRAELPTGGGPQLDFQLRGENLPFVRRAGLLVRGDLDLTLTTPENRPPRIGGTVRLRDSLFLTDVRALIPSGTKSGGGRPPYFAVQTPPLDAWGLAVKVEGERFLRLRTPVFNGTATARFTLSGTLGEPKALGEAIIDDGNIRLPFASFEVRQGQVRLTAEQTQPQIWLTGVTRRYGYDLRMELTGPVTSPNLTFTSSPPLDAEQVLLLVMTGQPPTDEIATTNRQRVARVGAFFGQSLLGSLSGDPDGADRLTISSGENISEQGRETYNIEYKLDEKWALTGEYDEFDEYYGGVKWRFYEKGGEKKDAD